MEKTRLGPICSSIVKVYDSYAYHHPNTHHHHNTTPSPCFRMEKTCLGEICSSIVEVYDLTECYIAVNLDRHLISQVHTRVQTSIVLALLPILVPNTTTIGLRPDRVLPHLSTTLGRHRISHVSNK